MDRLVGLVSKKKRVIVVGAGASGFAAAARLIAAGFTGDDILILEASNRIGGRVNTTTFEGYTVEVGAQWIHGEQGNCVYKMAKQEPNLIDDSATDFIKAQCVLSDKTLVDVNVTSDLFIKSTQIRDDVRVTNKGCFADYFIPRYNEYVSSKFPTISPEVKNGFLEWIHQLQNSLEGSDSWRKTAVSTLLAYRECEGNSLIKWNNGGYFNIFRLISNQLGITKSAVLNRVILNKEVVQIDWNDTKKDGVSVKCADGTKYSADYCIVTVSLGVLKHRHSTLFQPGLPVDKVRAIKGLGIGTVNKLFVKFPYKWWPDECLGFSFLWTPHDLNNTDFIKGDMNWAKDVFGFYIVDGAEKLLCGWVVGESARNMEQLSNEVVLDVCHKLLDKFLGGHYHIPKPDSLLRSKWQSERHVRGSYSFRSIDSDAMNVTHAQLAEPLVNDFGNKVVFFAGEATHPYFFSTVHGAVETGLNQAEHVISTAKQQSTSVLQEEVLVMVEEKKKDENGDAPPNEYSVIVVGAGMAGLGACKTLVDAGCTNILLLEAENEPGGRVQSTSVQSPTGTDLKWLELGAQWLHGENSALHTIAKSNHLISSVKSAEGLGQYLIGNGKEVEPTLVGDVSDRVAQILEDCEQFWSEKDLEPPPSVGLFLNEQFEEYLEKHAAHDSPQVKQIKRDLFEWHIRFQVIDNSCDNMNDLSARSWGRYEFCGGDDYINFKSSYSSLVKCLVNELPQRILKLNTPVLNISYNNQTTDNCVSLHSNNNNNSNIYVNGLGDSLSPVIVTCKNGIKYSGRHVIVTSSVGYLKRHHKTMFKPILPSTFVNCIEKIGFSTINKIFLCYEKPWWSKDEHGFQLIWPHSNGVQLETNQMWMRDVSGFDVLSNIEGVLLGWVGRSGALAVEHLTEQQIGDHCTQLLKYFTGRRHIPQPDRVIRSRWHSKEYVCGGYSHLTLKCDLSPADDDDASPENFSKPVYVQTWFSSKHPAILFAGEATHEKYFSTTHGAFQTGERQANVLLEFMKNENHLSDRDNDISLKSPKTIQIQQEN